MTPALQLMVPQDAPEAHSWCKSLRAIALVANPKFLMLPPSARVAPQPPPAHAGALVAARTNRLAATIRCLCIVIPLSSKTASARIVSQNRKAQKGPLAPDHHRRLGAGHCAPIACSVSMAWWSKAGVDPLMHARAHWRATHPLPIGPSGTDPPLVGQFICRPRRPIRSGAENYVPKMREPRVGCSGLV